MVGPGVWPIVAGSRWRLEVAVVVVDVVVGVVVLVIAFVDVALVVLFLLVSCFCFCFPLMSFLILPLPLCGLDANARLVCITPRRKFVWIDTRIARQRHWYASRPLVGARSVPWICIIDNAGGGKLHTIGLAGRSHDCFA